MRWIADDINALFSLYFDKLSRIEPETVLRMTLVAICATAVIIGLSASLFPLFVSWLAELHTRWMDGRKVGKK